MRDFRQFLPLKKKKKNCGENRKTTSQKHKQDTISNLKMGLDKMFDLVTQPKKVYRRKKRKINKKTPYFKTNKMKNILKYFY